MFGNKIITLQRPDENQRPKYSLLSLSIKEHKNGDVNVFSLKTFYEDVYETLIILHNSEVMLNKYLESLYYHHLIIETKLLTNHDQCVIVYETFENISVQLSILLIKYEENVLIVYHGLYLILKFLKILIQSHESQRGLQIIPNLRKLAYKIFCNAYDLSIIQLYFGIFKCYFKFENSLILSNHKYLQNLLLILVLHQDSRVRSFALHTLLDYHCEFGMLLPKQIYNLVNITIDDDESTIRLLSVILLHQIAVTYPDSTNDTWFEHPNQLLQLFSRQFINDYFQFSNDDLNPTTILFEILESSYDDQTSPKKEVRSIEREGNNNDKEPFVNFAFTKLCNIAINDISAVVRALAVYLLAFPYILGRDGNAISRTHLPTHVLNSSRHFQNLIKLCRLSPQFQPQPRLNQTKERCLWPLINTGSNELENVAEEIVNQTLDKRVLVSNMRRKRSYHERAQQAFVGGQSTKAISDKPMEVVEDENIIAGDAGVFVHGLEDESSIVRKLTIESMCILALRTTITPQHDSSTNALNRLAFSYKTVEYLVDMFNDEITEVRLLAILGLCNILTFTSHHFPSSLKYPSSSTSISSFNAGISFRNDQIEFVLSALEDASEDIRHALRLIISNCKVNETASVLLIVRFLLQNMVKYEEDYLSVYECFRDFGRHHSTLILPLIPDLLCFQSPYDLRKQIYIASGHTEKSSVSYNSNNICAAKKTVENEIRSIKTLQKIRENEEFSPSLDFKFDSTEQDVTEDKAYVAVLTLVLNAIIGLKSDESEYVFSILPSYITDRHYPYLKDTYPVLFHHRENVMLQQEPRHFHNNLNDSSINSILDFLREDIILSQISRITSTEIRKKSFEEIYLPIIEDCKLLNRMIGNDWPAYSIDFLEDDLSKKREIWMYRVKYFVQSCSTFLALYLKVRHEIIIYYDSSSASKGIDAREITMDDRNFKKVHRLLLILYSSFFGLTPELMESLDYYKSILLLHNFPTSHRLHGKKRKIDEVATITNTNSSPKKCIIKSSSLTEQQQLQEDFKMHYGNNANKEECGTVRLKVDDDVMVENKYLFDNRFLTRQILRYFNPSEGGLSKTDTNNSKHSSLLSEEHLGLAPFLLYRLKARLIKPSEKKDKESARKFIAGLALKIPVECQVLVAPYFSSSGAVPTQPYDSFIDDNDTGQEKSMENNFICPSTLHRYFKIQIKYPNNKIQMCDILERDVKYLGHGHVKIDSNVYVESNKPWTDAALIELTPVIRVSWKDIKSNTFHNTNNGGGEDMEGKSTQTCPSDFNKNEEDYNKRTKYFNEYETIRLGNSVKIFVYPRPMAGR